MIHIFNDEVAVVADVVVVVVVVVLSNILSKYATKCNKMSFTTGGQL